MKQISLKDFWKLSEEERGIQYQYLSEHDKFLVRTSMNPGAIASQCKTCKHYRGFGKCDAFPDNIPHEIISNKFEHTASYEGDQGISFEPQSK